MRPSSTAGAGGGGRSSRSRQAAETAPGSSLDWFRNQNNWRSFMSLKSPVAFLALFPAALLAQAPAPPPRPAHVEPAGGKSGGIAIEFSPRKLADAERSPEGELKAILKATGTLKTERPLRYRATVLPAGSYPVHVTGGEPAG